MTFTNLKLIYYQLKDHEKIGRQTASHARRKPLDDYR